MALRSSGTLAHLIAFFLSGTGTKRLNSLRGSILFDIGATGKGRFHGWRVAAKKRWPVLENVVYYISGIVKVERIFPDCLAPRWTVGSPPLRSGAASHRAPLTVRLIPD
jgi:hypothetical protein